ncbi:MAG TPA: RHS repeat-associated core domain-containing protein [Actinocrinis sp.]|jgi:RHS repeat-associated protein
MRSESPRGLAVYLRERARTATPWRKVRVRMNRLGAAPLSLITVAALLIAPPGAAAAQGLRPAAPKTAPVPVSVVTPAHTSPKAMPAYHASAAWPAAGSAVADLPASAAGDATQQTNTAAGATGSPATVRVGGLPVTVAAVGAASSGAASQSSASQNTMSQGSATAVSRVRVSVAAHASATAAGVDGVLLGLARADGGAAASTVSVTIEDSSFAQVYGADYTSRLRLVQLPACALTTPKVAACQVQTPVATENDTSAGTLSGEVTMPAAAPAVLAATSTASGGGGDFTATSLKSSGTWAAGGSSGAFTYEYPIPAPAVPGSLTPDVALSYNSQSVDGLTSATNNQPSFVGDGWEYSPGFVERSLPECLQVSTADPTGDECWSDTNQAITLSLNGLTTTLVDDPTTGWHAQNDNGDKVSLETGASNGDDDSAASGEYWVITTTDGTKYYFGQNELPGYASGDATTNSVDTEPVFSTASGQPCYSATFKSSYCATMAYRWNLDYVVDTHGDAIAYYYSTETNHYGADKGAETLPYIRGSYLTKAVYGFRAGQAYSTSAKPAAQVLFNVNGRCDTSTTGCAISTLTSSTAKDWPDVPYDTNCASSCTANTYWSPSFWSEYELTSIQTEALVGSAYQDVDSYALAHAFPATGDSTSPALWLSSITQTGQDASSSSGYITLPPVTFTGQPLANRAILSDGYDPLTRERIVNIETEAGENVTVDYSAPACGGSQPSSQDTNTMLCYPQYWTPPTATAPILDWFNKYVVQDVTEQDTTGGGPPVQTSYNYVGTPAWHFDDNPVVKSSYRDWDVFRGYSSVQTFTGTAPDPVTETQTTYFRGMDGDQTSSGGTTSASVTDSRGESIPDSDQYAGETREAITYNASGGVALNDTITDPWSQQTAAQPRSGAGLSTLYAYQTGTADTRTYEPLASGGTRESQTTYTHDTYGRVTQTSDVPDTSNAALDTCSTVSYATNASSWILDLAAQTTVTAVPCGTTPSYPTQMVSQVADYYDGSTTLGAAPTAGTNTMTKKTVGVDKSGTPTSQVTTSYTVDEYGRVLNSTDGDNGVTNTVYTPATGAQPSEIAVTDPMGHTTATYYDPASGLPTSTVDSAGYTTTGTYDALGRLVAVWDPGEPTNASASTKYAYDVSDTSMSTITTSTLGPQGTYRASETLYDALLRTREVQQQTLDGGRDISLTWYNSVGEPVKSTSPFYTSGGLDDKLVSVTDSAVPSETGYVYDGADRVTRQVSFNIGNETWETDTSYQGVDQTTVNPPSGGTPTVTLTGAEGRTAEMEQYNTATATGTPTTVTEYTHDPAGDLASVTDPAGDTTSYGYDMLGQQVSQIDPDGGVSTTTYDADGNALTTTDSRDKTLTYVYDADNRKTAEYDTTGNAAEDTADEVASWTYDTKAVGYLTSSTSYQDGAPFTVATLGFNTFAEPTGEEVSVPSIPATEGGLAGNYERQFSYDTYTGLMLTQTDQAAGGLPQETVDYGYDAYGRPVNVSGLDSYVSNLTYSEYDQPSQYTFGTSDSYAQLTLNYDEQTQELQNALTTTSNSSIPLDDTTYAYNNAQEVTQVDDLQGESGSQVTNDQCYGYNDLEQLTTAWTPASSATTACQTTPTAANASSVLGGYEPYWQSWTYDTAGNRTGEVDHNVTGNTTADTTTGYSYPSLGSNTDQPNALTQSTATTGSSTSTTSYGYDAAGDTTAINGPSGDQSMTWDDEGTLQTDTTSAGATDYYYDASGNLLLRQDPKSTTLFLPDEQLVQTGSGSSATVTGTRYYVMGDTTVAARSSSGADSYLIPDRQGSDTLQINASSLGAVRESYTPYGTPRSGAPSGWIGDTGYVGGSVDPTTGLVNLGAREYDPTTGRFLSLDPILEAGSPQDLNGYDYAGNNPTTNEDPTGQMPCDGEGRCGSFQYLEKLPGNGGGGGGGGGGGSWFTFHPPTYTPTWPPLFFSLNHLDWSWFLNGIKAPAAAPKPPPKKPTVRAESIIADVLHALHIALPKTIPPGFDYEIFEYSVIPQVKLQGGSTPSLQVGGMRFTVPRIAIGTCSTGFASFVCLTPTRPAAGAGAPIRQQTNPNGSATDKSGSGVGVDMSVTITRGGHVIVSMGTAVGSAGKSFSFRYGKIQSGGAAVSESDIDNFATGWCVGFSYGAGRLSYAAVYSPGSGEKSSEVGVTTGSGWSATATFGKEFA